MNLYQIHQVWSSKIACRYQGLKQNKPKFSRREKIERKNNHDALGTLRCMIDYVLIRETDETHESEIYRACFKSKLLCQTAQPRRNTKQINNDAGNKIRLCGLTCVRIHSIRDTTIFESLNNSKNCIIKNFTIDYNLLGIYCTVIKSDLLLQCIPRTANKPQKEIYRVESNII